MPAETPGCHWSPFSLDQRMAAAAALHRLRFRWRRGGREWALGACGLGMLLLVLVFTVGYWIGRGAGGGVAPQLGSGGGGNGGGLVPLTLVRSNAVDRGAVCLDGSPPGYHIDRGFGNGVNRWVIHLEGGGWCNSVASCSSRRMTMLGSSNLMEREVPFNGILSRNPSQNPDFYNWNRVRVRYCDGASFSGNAKSEDQDGTGLFLRGQRIWEAIMDELMAGGLATAKQALLTGCSAGGLATFIHCDDFQARLSNDATVKCFSDAGFFLDVKDISGKRTMRSFYHDVVHLHGVANNLPKGCIRRIAPSRCFFPQEIIKSISVPFLVLNPAYDFWQVQHILAPTDSDPNGLWVKCKLDIHSCDSNQIDILQGFRSSMVDALSNFRNKKNGGILLNSCFIHCQSMSDITWHSPHSPRIGNKTLAEAVGDWYFNRGAVDIIDCPYPCNPTCYHMKFN